MNTEWSKVFVAAFFEVLWVIGLKHAEGFWQWSGTLIAILVSFYLLIIAGRKLPVGTVYAVFVGLGTSGTILAEIVLFDEPFNFIKIILILILLVGVIGLKLVTDQNEEENREGVDS